MTIIENAEFDMIAVDHIAVRATAGAEISACVREAFMLSLMSSARVVLTHNEKEYFCDPRDVLRLALSSSDAVVQRVKP